MVKNRAFSDFSIEKFRNSRSTRRSIFLKLPVCASNVVDLTEQVGGSGILFDPNDVYDIAKKISILLNNENIRN